MMTEMIPEQPVGDEIAGLWRQMGNVTRAVTLFGVRFDRVDADIAELKGEVGALRKQVNRLERATESGFRRVDAQFERLVSLIQRDELKKS
jgi:hypothetical protein